MVTATQAATAALSVLVVGACGAVLLYGQNTLWPQTESYSESQIERPANTESKKTETKKAESNVEAKRESTTASGQRPASTASDTLAAAAAAVGSTPSGPGSGISSASASPATDAHEPSFDVARVDKDGAAVIAGRAAPGAKVDLLRDGEVQDSTVADSSGQFVMTPPQLPPGSYKLTLKSTSRDGVVRQSASGVQVSGVQVSRSESAALPPAVASARAKAANEPANKAPNNTTKDANTASLAASPVLPSLSSRVVSHGDSLWRISRETYGAGTNYERIFHANRNKIRNPNLIYPGQTFTLPK